MAPDDPHRSNPNPHYRLYRSPTTGKPTIICVQDFDYPDYDDTRFLSPHAWATEAEATAAFLRYRDPEAPARDYRVTLTITAGGNPPVEFVAAGTITTGNAWPIIGGAIKAVTDEAVAFAYEAAATMTAFDRADMTFGRADGAPPC